MFPHVCLCFKPSVLVSMVCSFWALSFASSDWESLLTDIPITWLTGTKIQSIKWYSPMSSKAVFYVRFQVGKLASKKGLRFCLRLHQARPGLIISFFYRAEGGGGRIPAPAMDRPSVVAGEGRPSILHSTGGTVSLLTCA